MKKKSAIFTKKIVDFGGGRWIRTTEGIASRFTVCPLWPLGNSPILNCAPVGGAGGRTRTPDLLITNQLLYRLSYTSTEPASSIIITKALLFVKHNFTQIKKILKQPLIGICINCNITLSMVVY